MSDEGASRAIPRFASGEPAITILHLSDVQFGDNHRFADEGGGFGTLLQRLCDDLDLLKRENGLAPDLVALTGDLAERGKEPEFAQVAEFGEGLLRHLQLEPDRLLVVPGNHDINRSLCQAYFLRCESKDEAPKLPYWPKWEFFVGLINRLYRKVERYRFTEIEPWTLFEIPALKVVVAGFNSTIHESHLDADHHGFVGEAQLRWFRDRLVEYEGKGWLRVGLVHHNALRRASIDDENLRDANDLSEYLGELLHVLLHGHTHQGQFETLGTLPVISTGSAAVKRDQRPGPSPKEPGETPNQYQLVRLTRTGLWCGAREYTYERKRWIGDNRVSRSGDRWWYERDRTWPRTEATFPPSAVAPPDPNTVAAYPEPDDPMIAGDPDDLGHARRGGIAFVERAPPDLLDDVIDWCRIRGNHSVVKVTRVRHRGPWGHYARVLYRDGGLGLLGAYPGELTAEMLQCWIADVHDPFRGRGQPVSKLIVAASKIDPALRLAAQARGVEVERMIDFQHVLDTVGYSEKLRDWLAGDRRYPAAYYIEQRMRVWSPVEDPREPDEPAADWLAKQLRDHEGAFVLVLGPAGVGKTFLLREVARRLGTQQAITPILIELRNLELAHNIEELAAIQFTRFGLSWYPKAFRRDLEEGRLALLFDGFDELAIRVRSAAIPAHFERIYGAAVGRARIVVSSRTEHFASSGEIRALMTTASADATSLGGQFARVPRRQVLEVYRFERDDVAAYLRRRLGDRAGNDRFARLGRIHDLGDLARNPRMLGFLVDIPDDKLVQAARSGDSITSDDLYRIVVDDAWLAAEAARMAQPGAAPGPTVDALRDAATNLALQLWRDPSGRLTAEEVGAHVGGLLLRMCDDDPEWAKRTLQTRTLLTRDDSGKIAFVHQTVLEWLVVGRLVGEITGDVPGNHLEVGRLNAFMIDLLRQRLGDEGLERWARARLATPTTGVAAENAREVHKQLNIEATARVILRDQDLRGQDLGGQSLRHAILDRANLTGARLIRRDLTGASLVGAQLAYADFTDACLRDADFTGANLAFARFHRADLAGVRLTRARLTGTSFVGAQAVPALADTSTLGMVPHAPASVEAMYARGSWGECRVAMSPDGTLLASGQSDGSVRLWDCARGQLVRNLTGHDGNIVMSVTFSPDGQTLASGGFDATVRLWSVGDGRERARLAGHGGPVLSVGFSPDGQTLASGDNEMVRLWSIGDGRERARLVERGRHVWSVAFSPDGQMLASSDYKIVRLWNAGDGRERARLAGHGERVLSVAFSPDGRTLASGSDDATVRLWNVDDGRERARLAGHGGRVWSVAFSPDGQTLASGGDDATVRLWNTEDGRERARLAGHGVRILSVAFSPDGQTLASGGEGATLRLWNVTDGSERARPAGHGGRVWSVAFSPDGQTLASGGEDATLVLWNAEDGREHVLAGHGPCVWSVAFSPDGQTLAAGRQDATLVLWNASDGRERARLAGHGGHIRSVAFSPDGQTLASGGEDATLVLWNAEDGRERARLAGHRGPVFCVAFSPDGQTVASGGEDAIVRLWNVEDERDGARLTGHGGCVSCVTFSPDGQTLASGGDDATVRLWNITEGHERAQLAGHGGRVRSVAFSPDGQTLASGSADATVRLWNATEGAERAQLAGHGGPVFCVAFSPDGQMLASGSDDATVRLWDVASRRCLAILYGTPGGAVAARPDGRFRVRGDVAGKFWHVIGLHRYEVGDLDALIPGLRLAEDEPLWAPSPVP